MKFLSLSSPSGSYSPGAARAIDIKVLMDLEQINRAALILFI